LYAVGSEETLEEDVSEAEDRGSAASRSVALRALSRLARLTRFLVSKRLGLLSGSDRVVLSMALVADLL